MSSSTIPVEKLKGRDGYENWCFAMQAYLEHEGLWEYVQEGNDAEEYSAAKAARAKAKLILACDQSVYAYIRGQETAKGIWDALAKVFLDNGLCRRVVLLRKFTNLSLQQCKSTEDYVNQMISTVQSLKDINFEIEDEWVAHFMLAGLPESYAPMIMALQNQGKALNLEDIKLQLLQDQRMNAETGRSNALAVKDVVCYKCGQKGHFKSQCPRGGDSGGNGGSGGSGHSNSGNQKGGGSGRSSAKGKQHRGQGKSASESTLMAMCLKSQAVKEIDWIIDSGASSHMSYQVPEKCQAYRSKIMIANGSKVPVIGQGPIQVLLKKDHGTMQCTLSKVLYVPDFSVNLLSVRQICESGKKVVFERDKCSIFNGSDLIGTARVEDGLYKLNVVRDEHAAVARVDAQTWHRRLGHLNGEYMRKMAEKIGSCSVNSDCLTCVKGKMTRSQFKSSESRTTAKLELVHSDVGEMECVSLGGNRYYITFLDDYTRKVWIYPMKQKSGAFEKFRQFQLYAERESGRQIKVLRTDNGGEYVNGVFMEYLKKNGIKHELTVPYNPEQNGAAERVNRTIKEKVRCMLIDSGLSKSVWAEAANTAVYLINRCPAKAIDFKVPEEMWCERSVSLNHLRIFGSKVLSHTPKQKRKNLSDTGREGVLVGYGEVQKGYRVLYGDQVRVECSVRVYEGMFGTSSDKTRSSIAPLPVESSSVDDNDERVNEEGEDVDGSLYETAESGGDDGVLSVPTPYPPNATEEVRRSGRVRRPRVDPDFVYDEDFDNATEEAELCRTSRQWNQDPDSVYVALSAGMDPTTYAQVMQSNDSASWKSAMDAEMQSLKEHDTWELVERPSGVKVIGNRWVFQRKEDSGKEKFKARLVIRGFMQNDVGIETFSPVVRYETIRVVLGMAAARNWKLAKFDVRTAFLNGTLKERVFMEQPVGYADDTNRVCLLKRSLYGLKQSPKCWSDKLMCVMKGMGFVVSEKDPCMFIKNKLICLMYVDDGLIASETQEEALKVMNSLKKAFNITYSFDVTSYLGLEIDQTEEGIGISQKKYINSLVERFRLEEAIPVDHPMPRGWKPVDSVPFRDNTLYRELVGTLMYISNLSRPDISFVTNVLARGVENPSEAHFSLGKRTIRYLKGTRESKIMYRKNYDVNLIGYSDSDYGGDVDTRRSTSGIIILLNDSPIIWKSRLQKVVALSSCEAELVAGVDVAKECMWLRALIGNICTKIRLMIDNQSALKIIRNPVHHEKTKHIDIKLCYLRDVFVRNELQFEYCKTTEQLADPLTKPLGGSEIGSFRNKIMK